MEKKTFRSRISVLLMAVALLGFLPPLIPMIISGNIANPISVILVIIVLTFCGTRYIISEKKLYIKICWIIPCGSVDIKDIFSVERAYNPIPFPLRIKFSGYNTSLGTTYEMFISPAASIKRLRIEGYGIFESISPVREQEFLDTLKICNPKIDIQVNYKKGWWRIWDLDI